MSESFMEAARRLRRMNDMRSNFGKDKAPHQEDTRDIEDTAHKHCKIHLVGGRGDGEIHQGVNLKEPFYKGVDYYTKEVILLPSLVDKYTFSRFISKYEVIFEYASTESRTLEYYEETPPKSNTPIKVEISEWVDLLESKDGKVWLTFESDNLGEVVNHLKGLIDE